MSQTIFVTKIATKIKDLGLTAPILFLLEAHKPLAFIGSQFLLVTQPALDLFLPQNFVQHAVNLLQDPVQLEQLLVSLEAKSGPGTPSQELKSREAGL